MWEQFKTIALTAIVATICSSALWLAVLQRRWQRKDSKQKTDLDNSAAQISDRQVLSSELWRRIEKLELAEHAMVEEKIHQAEQIANLKADKKSLYQLTVEQEEELIVVRARNKTLAKELDECRRNNLQELMKGK